MGLDPAVYLDAEVSAEAAVWSPLAASPVGALRRVGRRPRLLLIQVKGSPLDRWQCSSPQRVQDPENKPCGRCQSSAKTGGVGIEHRLQCLLYGVDDLFLRCLEGTT